MHKILMLITVHAHLINFVQKKFVDIILRKKYIIHFTASAHSLCSNFSTNELSSTCYIKYYFLLWNFTYPQKYIYKYVLHVFVVIYKTLLHTFFWVFVLSFYLCLKKIIVWNKFIKSCFVFALQHLFTAILMNSSFLHAVITKYTILFNLSWKYIKI